MKSGKASYTTDFINGYLELIFIDAPGPISLRVSIANSELTVFEIDNIQGSHVIPVRLGVVDMKGESFRDNKTKWVLNDSLQFDIKGPLNTNVMCKVRYC